MNHLPPILKASHLNTGYFAGKQTQCISENVNIKLHQGKLIALIGVNGAGKSTLIRTLSGLQPAISGEILLQQQSLFDYTALDIAREISLVLTEKITFSQATVFDLVALGRQPYTNWMDQLQAEDINAINQALQLTETEELKHKKINELSDGQLQKALIAKALAQDTALILLDEPTSHLDLSYQVTLLKLMQKLAHIQNKSILYSTHDIDSAIQMADEIIIMLKNKTIQDTPCNLIEQGIFDDLFHHADLYFDKQKGKFVIK